MGNEFGAKVVVEEFTPGWRVLRPDGYALFLPLNLPNPVYSWAALADTLVGAKLDEDKARIELSRLLPQLGYARMPEVLVPFGNHDELIVWRPEEISDAIVTRAKITQATLQIMRNKKTDVVQEIREEYAFQARMRAARGELLAVTADTANPDAVHLGQLERFQKAHGGDLPVKDSPEYSDDLLALVGGTMLDESLTQSSVLKELEGRQYRPIQAPSIGTTRLRHDIADDNIANGVTQYLTAFGRTVIHCDWRWSPDGVPTVALHANEAFDELVLREHARTTLPRMVICANPRCEKKLFSPAKRTQRFCSGTCQDLVKKWRQRNIDRAAGEWAVLPRKLYPAKTKSAWIAERAQEMASDHAGGFVEIEKADVERRLKGKA